ncbi:MAG: DNA primase, partial [Pseudomonadota bacterium]
AIVPCIRNPGDDDMARMTVAEELAKLEAARGLDGEIADAVEDLSGVADEGVTWRLGQAAAAAAKASRSGQEDKTEYDVGDNGARISRSERDTFAALMDSIRFSKPQR